MKLLTVIGTTVALLFAVLKMWTERSSFKRKRIQEGVNLVAKGIEERDASKITAGFDTINRA